MNKWQIRVNLQAMLSTLFCMTMVLTGCYPYRSYPPAVNFTPTYIPDASPAPDSSNTYFVDEKKGSDVNSGTFGQPWRTIQKAASTVASGSTVIVTAGSYAELISVGKSN
ncbi:MAG: DUF1565 domain-containing protein, partial [Chloroflexi bacterium]|nr:DUF1565 domain-containing protein [Chloroflexota bacterium]